jgi:CIC family chloride channel protein
MGSTLGQLLRLSTPRLRICVGCGAAAGIAATFNAPIAGAFFAAEVILGGFSAAAFGPIVISSVAATVISRSMLGNEPAFVIPSYSIESPAEMLPYTVLGVVAAVAAVLFVKILHAMEEGFERLRAVPDFLQPVLGGLGVGAIAIAFPQIMGTGYDTIEGALRAELAAGVLLAVLGTKLLATSLTLGSGGSGGVFAPSLFMGAALGGTVGIAAREVAPFAVASPGAYAVVGMGAMVAATTHAPITAILIIFELTGDYRVITALMVSCILGHVIAQWLSRESIYTIKLMRRGIDLQEGQEINVLRQLKVGEVLRPEVETIPRTAKVQTLYERMVESDHYEFFTVDDEGRLMGVISVDDLRRSLPHLEALHPVAIAEDIAVSPVIYLRETDTLDTAMQQFGKRTLEELPVLPAGDSLVPIGTVHRQDVINAYNKEILKVDLGGSLWSRLDSATKLKSWETVGGYVLAHVDVPHRLQGKPLSELQLRRQASLQIILIERGDAQGDARFETPGADSALRPGDRIVVFGARADVEQFFGRPV